MHHPFPRLSAVLLSLVATLALTASCTSRPTDVRPSNSLPDIWPDYIGVTVPADIAPLNFAMADDSVTTIDVTVAGADGSTLHDGGADCTDFDIDDWHQLLSQNKGQQLTVSICAEKAGVWTSYRNFTISVSSQPLDEWGVTYRRIAPSYEVYSHMALCQRNLSNFDEVALADNCHLQNSCLNCHTANRTNPDQYVYHVRGANGATAVSIKGKTELLQASNDTLGGSMVYPYWHPGGRYCAFSTNKTTQMFHTRNVHKRIEVYDTASDVFVYDTQTRTALVDTLIMKNAWAENTPAFSPDGRWLYFTTARRQVYPDDYDKELYSLCRVAFDASTGRIGTTVDTLVNSRLTGKSATWPRPSYDGRYLMYTQTDYGYFSVWHPEADLWMLDLQTGATTPLTAVNSSRSESLHNWSTNSRWFLFTSRRDDGLYTRLYLAAIDDSGKPSKPFLLPQRDPKNYYRRLLYSYNTPDFASRPIDISAEQFAEILRAKQRLSTHTLQP